MGTLDDYACESPVRARIVRALMASPDRADHEKVRTYLRLISEAGLDQGNATIAEFASFLVDRK